jgi:electron transfer flavoprotein beta subunit
MSYNIVVLAKQVPDTRNVSSNAMKEDGTVNRSQLPAIFNPEDIYALESALELKDRYGGTVTVITMGPPRASDVLRDSLYRGADKVILLTDRKFAGADTLATSYVLAKAIEKLGKFDFVFCGHQAIDGDTAQVGPQTAEKLNVPQLTFVEDVQKIENNKITVRRNTGNGYEILESPYPALLTILKTKNEPRPPMVKLLMKYKKAKSKSEIANNYDDYSELSMLEEKGLLIEEWSASNLDVEPDKIGLSGSPTKVKKIESVVLGVKENKVINSDQEGIDSLMKELINKHIIG